MSVTFEHMPGTWIVRLRWVSGGIRMHADFDACETRGLTAMESAVDWARRVLGWKDPQADAPLVPALVEF